MACGICLGGCLGKMCILNKDEFRSIEPFLDDLMVEMSHLDVSEDRRGLLKMLLEGLKKADPDEDLVVKILPPVFKGVASGKWKLGADRALKAWCKRARRCGVEKVDEIEKVGGMMLGGALTVEEAHRIGSIRRQVDDLFADFGTSKIPTVDVLNNEIINIYNRVKHLHTTGELSGESFAMFMADIARYQTIIQNELRARRVARNGGGIILGGSEGEEGKGNEEWPPNQTLPALFQTHLARIRNIIRANQPPEVTITHLRFYLTRIQRDRDIEVLTDDEYSRLFTLISEHISNLTPLDERVGELNLGGASGVHNDMRLLPGNLMQVNSFGEWLPPVPMTEKNIRDAFVPKKLFTR